MYSAESCNMFPSLFPFAPSATFRIPLVYKVSFLTVFVRHVVPSHKWPCAVHQRGEAGFLLVLQGLPCGAARSWRREAAVGQSHPTHVYMRNAWFPKVLPGSWANRAGPFLIGRAIWARNLCVTNVFEVFRATISLAGGIAQQLRIVKSFHVIWKQSNARGGIRTLC